MIAFPTPSRALEVQLAVAKIGKYASSESGDTVEIIERPNGGISVVVADGQRSGRSAKVISNLVVQKAISLLAEGVRDGAVARATHDYLLTLRGGKVSAEMEIISVDLISNTLVISRNARCPVIIRHGQEVSWLDHATDAIGIYRNTKPSVNELELEEGLTVLAFTDGVWGAGSPAGARIDLPAILLRHDPDLAAPADQLADSVLAEALSLDHGRARDDATVIVVKLVRQQAPEQIRRLMMRFPI
ncbi:MAG: PP2C family protein-serine/threonine phosphatase [Chloroflexota bacterium]|nr:PP2C family protein-serine/threonine phosphatase [Chloroflexota bacterium]